MADDIEEKIVFCHGQGDDGVSVLLLGIPQGAWDFMKDLNAQHIDLRKLGLPIKLILYGGKDHSECIGVIERAAANDGVALLDERRKNFGIDLEEDHAER